MKCAREGCENEFVPYRPSQRFCCGRCAARLVKCARSGCEAVFEIVLRGKSTRRFCSQACATLHWQQSQRNINLKCAHPVCSNIVPPKRNTGGKKLYCSRACSLSSSHQILQGLAERQCARDDCQKRFKPKHINQQFCCTLCGAVARYRAKHGWTAPTLQSCETPGCGKWFLPRNKDQKHCSKACGMKHYSQREEPRLKPLRQARWKKKRERLMAPRPCSDCGNLFVPTKYAKQRLCPAPECKAKRQKEASRQSFAKNKSRYYAKAKIWRSNNRDKVLEKYRLRNRMRQAFKQAQQLNRLMEKLNDRSSKPNEPTGE